MRPHTISRQTQNILLIFLISTLLSGCGNENNKKIAEEASAHPDVLASFIVSLPVPIPEGSQLSVEWVDLLNIHSLNPSFSPMQKVDDIHYQLDIPAKKGSLLKYRYVKTGKSVDIEMGLTGQPLIARYFFVSDHSRIQDKILSFSELPENTPLGNIEGSVARSSDGEPISGAIVTTNGLSTISSIDGTFRLAGIPAGTQNITIFSPDQFYEPFEQQAVIEKDTITPIKIGLIPRKKVNVTFIVKSPSNTPKLASLRLFGNCSQLGDNSAELFGGTGSLQNLSPTLTRQADNEFYTVLQLPAGAEIQYLYSMGDSFWNRETVRKGSFTYRRIFIPDDDVVVEDIIDSWDTINFQPVTFQFAPPPDLPDGERIQIQFNAFGWMDPLEMWPVGDGTFEYQLFNPLNFSKAIDYRFCHSGICGTRDPLDIQDQASSFQASASLQALPTVAGRWSTWMKISEPTVVTTEQSPPREDGFVTAIEWSDSYRPGWKSYASTALDTMAGFNANTLILPVSWTFRSTNPLWLDVDLSQNPSYQDLLEIISLAKSKGLKVFLMAVTQYQTSPTEFWNEFSPDPPAWDRFFKELYRFYGSTSNLAKISGADGLILGDATTSGLIGRTYSYDGVLESYPEDAKSAWDKLLSKIRNTYTGTILLALNFDDLSGLQDISKENFDGLYLRNLGEISDSSADITAYTDAIAVKLDETLLPMFEENGKAMWIGLDFPSITTAYLGCVDISGHCVDPAILNFPNPAQPDLGVSLQEQIKLYNAALPEINRRNWLKGVASRRFSIPGNDQDQSSSVHGKPASDIIWYWYSSMTGKPTQ